MHRRVVVSVLPLLGVLAVAGPASAAPSKVSLTVVQRSGTLASLQLSARTPAAARTVVFRGRWAGSDGVRRTYELGQDRVASDGFGLRWNAGRVSAGTTVTLTARVLDGRGRVLGTSAGRAWRREAKPSPVAGEPVTGTIRRTCAAGTDCTVAVRDAPTTQGVRVTDLASGARVSVRCRAAGERVSTPADASAEWLQIAPGQWVSALYVTTSAAAQIPECEN